MNIDAMGCRKANAQTVVPQGGGYFLSVKDTQSNLNEAIQERTVR